MNRIERQLGIALEWHLAADRKIHGEQDRHGARDDRRTVALLLRRVMVPNPPSSAAQEMPDHRWPPLSCRLFTGTGKYPSMDLMQQSIEGLVRDGHRGRCRVQAVAAGRRLMEAIDWTRIWMLPNTASCTNAEEAVQVARLP